MVLVIPALALALDPTTNPALDYTVHVEPAQQAADVTLVASGLGPGPLELAMAERFAFVVLDEPLLESDVTASGATGRELDVERTGPYRWRIESGGAESLSVRYRVGLGHRELAAVAGDEYEFPYVDVDHGLLVAGALLARPVDRAGPEPSRRVRFELPEGWDVLAPWTDHPAGGFAPGSDTALVGDLIAIGAWERRSIPVGGFEAIVAVAPRQPGLLAAVAGPLEEIVRAELAIFDRAPSGRYLFLFGRPDLPRGFGGSPKTRSMTLSIDPGLRADADAHVEHLVAHEFFHTWAAGRFPLPGELRWVNEGVTDYYAHLVPLRLGRMPLDRFHERLCEELGKAEQGPHDLSLTDAGGPAFFAGGAAYQRVYGVGLLLGAWLDAAIRQRDPERRLDDLMRAFLNDPRWGRDARPGVDDFFERVAELAGADAAARLRRLTSTAGPIDWVPLFAEVGVELAREERPPQLSLRADLDGTTIRTIDPAGIGYRLGLRSGDRVIEVNGRPVGSADEVRAAWSLPDGDRLEAVVEREGRERFLDAPLGPQASYAVVRGVWGMDAAELPD